MKKDIMQCGSLSLSYHSFCTSSHQSHQGGRYLAKSALHTILSVNLKFLNSQLNHLRPLSDPASLMSRLVSPFAAGLDLQSYRRFRLFHLLGKGCVRRHRLDPGPTKF